jgi:hypothetical protein
LIALLIFIAVANGDRWLQRREMAALLTEIEAWETLLLNTGNVAQAINDARARRDAEPFGPTEREVEEDWRRQYQALFSDAAVEAIDMRARITEVRVMKWHSETIRGRRAYLNHVDEWTETSRRVRGLGLLSHPAAARARRS